ncbi:MAG: HAD hydrolase-like protein [Acidobacteria bacterium]|nr:HAD hydrolase-like protein [Acidobacteriota bacterium]
MNRPSVLLVSPHSDDIAFSLGGALAAGLFDGWRRHQCTIFVTSCHAPYAPELTTGDAVTAVRRAEDDAFCAFHDIELERGDLAETLVRGYPSIASIFEPRRPADDPLFGTTCELVARLVRGFDLVIAPLGVGRHIEHVMVREACRRARPDTLFYEDLPYAGDLSTDELDAWAVEHLPGASCLAVDVSAHLGTKSDRLLAYGSQVAPADLDKVLEHSRRRRPAPELRVDGGAGSGSCVACEVLWGPREVLARLSDSSIGTRRGRTPKVLVDFDGTLIDSVPDLVALTLEALAAWRLEPSPRQVEALLGLPTGERLRRHGVPEGELAAGESRFLELHARCRYTRSRPQPGARRWLAATHHVSKWIVSASPRNAVAAGLDEHGLAHHFDRIIGAPAAAGLDKVAALAPERERLVAAGSWFLGDQRSDLEAARSVGARFALVLNPRNRDLAREADRVLESFEELLVEPLEEAWIRSS